MIYDFENSVIKCQTKQNFFAVNCKFKIELIFYIFSLGFYHRIRKLVYGIRFELSIYYLTFDFFYNVYLCLN
ncbi:MAG: hypothetical protein CVU08_13855 [Bacteroidetes bacterium HGW-Bacteroidetes-3]|nr:MAG: hypothetical protein CVU08_13855 [Bacteroidetes bacterium HGW-Bacteroidetes-3]